MCRRLLHVAMSLAAIEKGVMRGCCPCDIFISVKVSHLLCIHNSKVRISALEEDIKALPFDPRGVVITRSYCVE